MLNVGLLGLLGPPNFLEAMKPHWYAPLNNTAL